MSTEATGVSFLLLSVLSSAILIYVANYVWKRRWLYYYASKLDGPLAFPLIGSAYIFTGGQEVFLDKLMKVIEKYHSKNSVSKLWLGSHLHIITTEPNDIERVLNNSLNKAWFFEYAKEGLGNSLLLGPLDIWRPHRKIISLTFNQKILNSFVDIFASHANTAVKELDKCCGKDYFDVFPIVFQTSLNIICETSMGLNVKNIEGITQYLDWVTRAQSLMTIRFFKLYLHFEQIWKRSSLSKELTLFCTNIWNFVEAIVETKRHEKMTSSTAAHNDLEDLDVLTRPKIFLDFMIDITDKEGKWTNHELTEETHMMVFAGSETTALIQSAVLVMLAMHQDIQSKVYKEIFEIFGNSDRAPQPEDLSRMVYLEMVIKESMRLFPVAPFLTRSIDTDVKLEKCTAPKGSTAFIPNSFIQRSPKFWKNPLEFDPDRFLPEEVAKRHRYVYIPFSAGPRDCLGKRYAMMSMKIVLSTIIRHFRVDSTEYKAVADIEMKINVMAKAKKGYTVKMERRQYHHG